MPNYCRNRFAGTTYFFTVNLADRRSTLLTDRISDLRHAFARAQIASPVHFDAIVILPDHIHAVWSLPEGDSDYSERWRKIKHRFSRRIGQHLPRSHSKRAKRETGIWQRRFWEHTVRDEADYRAHVAYCWSNPVKHGLVNHAAGWPYSSIHRDIKAGRADPEWLSKSPECKFGE